MTEPDLPADPWERFGWVMSVIWLVFLAFPLQQALTLDEPWGRRALGVGLVLAFAAVYVAAFVRLDSFHGPDAKQGQAWLVVGVLVGLASATAVVVGEESGSLDQMAAKVADFYEADVDAAVDAMSSLLEPMIMAILGVLVGGLVVAMYLPIFKLGAVV